jgi:hypothetical protein
MLSIRVGSDVYGLGDESAAELVERVSQIDPVLRGAADSGEVAAPDPGQLAEIGTVLEAWALETDGDLPGDLEELRLAIAEELD